MAVCGCRSRFVNYRPVVTFGSCSFCASHVCDCERIEGYGAFNVIADVCRFENFAFVSMLKVCIGFCVAERDFDLFRLIII